MVEQQNETKQPEYVELMVGHLNAYKNGHGPILHPFVAADLGLDKPGSGYTVPQLMQAARVKLG